MPNSRGDKDMEKNPTNITSSICVKHLTNNLHKKELSSDTSDMPHFKSHFIQQFKPESLNQNIH